MSGRDSNVLCTARLPSCPGSRARGVRVGSAPYYAHSSTGSSLAWLRGLARALRLRGVSSSSALPAAWLAAPYIWLEVQSADVKVDPVLWLLLVTSGMKSVFVG